MLYDRSIYKKNDFGKISTTTMFILCAMFISCFGQVSLASTDGSEQSQGLFPVQTIQSINFRKDMTVRDALRFLAAKYEKNIIPSAKVNSQLTITSLYDVTFEEALGAILGHVYKYEAEGNFIRVYTADEYQKIKQDESRLICKVFTLYYITAQEASKLITPVVSKSGQIQSSTPADIGVATGDTVGGQPGGDTVAIHDTLVVYDFPENIAKIGELIKSIDIRPQQVLVEATILSATLTEETKFGIDLNLLAGQSITGISNIAGGLPGALIETTGFAAAGTGLNVGVTAGKNVAMFITALEEITDTTVIANPKILAVNKQVGSVFIGQKLGYREGDVVSDGGVVTEGAVKFLDSGTKLSFRPYICGDGYIRMDIYPKDSSAVVNADGVPTETTAETATNVMVKDGETIIISGLFRDDITATRTQVPLLGDIPFLGALFRSTDDTNIRKEVIILFTCHIVKDSDEINGVASAADIDRKRIGARDSFQWVDRTRQVEDRYSKAVEYYSMGYKLMALEELNWVLELRPSYIEALRLKDRIIGEMEPDNPQKIERIMLDTIEKQDGKNLYRRYGID